MSAETPRRSRSQPANSSGPAIIAPQQVTDLSIIDSVAGFINEVVPAAYSTPAETKDQLQWVHFEQLDKNQLIYIDGVDCDSGIPAPLVLVLGYGSGIQVWAVPINGDATEVLSWRHGSVRVLRILPNPSCSTYTEKIDLFADKRPLMVLCDTATPGPQYFSLSFISLKTGDQVKNIKFKNPVLDVQANKRSVVVTFTERIAIFDALTLEDRLTVTTCFLSPGVYPNPVALGTRWLAYAEKKLIPARRSGGGNEGEGVQSYTATVLHAAKSLGKGLRELGETVASSLAGTSTVSVPHVPPVMNSDLVQPGIVTILDLQNAENGFTERGLPVESVVAHFTAHSEAIVCLQFDPSGMLLLSADRRGHDFHLFRIQPHPGGPSLAAVHHLYTLHRGDTSARVQDMCFSPDSRWVAVSTLRGTTHVFPITPYGGSVGMRTHATAHVVNRMSRFQRSAGLPVEGRSNSPVSHHHEVPVIHSGIPYRNPRLPPYPHPTVVHPLAQLRQSINLPISTTALTQRTGSGRSRLGSSSEDCTHAPLRVAACFAAPRAWLETINQPRDNTHKQRRPVESLFVISSHGTLIQYDLEPKHATNVPKERVCDDTPIELKVSAKAQWNLQRHTNSCDIQAPLSVENMLLSSLDGESETRYPKRDYTDDRWLSQVEIVTHAGPHRRLWMGPQFTFKMYNGNSSSPISVLETEAMEVGSSSPMRPARSKPLNMPDDGVPVLIESGSASSFEQSPRLLDREVPGHCGESQLKEDLADAMLESPGRAKGETGGRCVLVSVKHNAHTVAKVVNPLGTVVTLPPEPPVSDPPPPVEDAEIHENCDESLFRPVITTSRPAIEVPTKPRKKHLPQVVPDPEENPPQKHQNNQRFQGLQHDEIVHSKIQTESKSQHIEKPIEKQITPKPTVVKPVIVEQVINTVVIDEKPAPIPAVRRTKKSKSKLGVRVSNPIIIEKPIEDIDPPIIIENPSGKIEAIHIIRDNPSPIPCIDIIVPDEDHITQDMWSSVECTPFSSRFDHPDDLDINIDVDPDFDPPPEYDRNYEDYPDENLDLEMEMRLDLEEPEPDVSRPVEVEIEDRDDDKMEDQTEDQAEKNNQGGSQTETTTESDDSGKNKVVVSCMETEYLEWGVESTSAPTTVTTMPVQKTSKKKAKKKRK